MDSPIILVLEDHSLQRAAAVSVLRRLGYTGIIEATDGHDAIDKIQATGGVDVAICDLNMAGMDGLTFLRQASQLSLMQSIIICSSLAEDLLSTVDHIVKQQGLDLLGIITKPLCAPALKTLLLKHKLKRSDPAKSSVRPIRMPSESTIRRAIANQEFRAYYQPKFSLRTGEIDGAEVLARWQTLDHGLISPSFFLPSIQRYGLVNELFYNLLAQGLSLQKLVQSNGKPFKLAFNLDVSQLNNLDLVERIKLLLRTHGASPQGLIFELTETGLLEIPHVGMENMVRLRMLGVGLAIDDFGVGYSSLERLCQMPFNELKLDAGFIQRMDQHRYIKVIQGTLSLAKDLNMRVVAEGIETAEQLRGLSRLGCQWGQGYFYARPMSWAHMAGWRFEGDQSAWRRAIDVPGC